MSSYAKSIVFHTLSAMEHFIMVALVTSGAVLLPKIVLVEGGCIFTSWDHRVVLRAPAYWDIMTVGADSLFKRTLTNINALTKDKAFGQQQHNSSTGNSTNQACDATPSWQRCSARLGPHACWQISCDTDQSW